MDTPPSEFDLIQRLRIDLHNTEQRLDARLLAIEKRLEEVEDTPTVTARTLALFIRESGLTQ